MTTLSVYDMGEFEKFYNIALRFLSYRPRSEKEVRDHLNIKYQISKIKNKRVEKNELGIQSIIDKVIQKLKEQKFINDEEFGKWWVEQRTTFKPRSLRLIKTELRQKGISNEVVDKMIYDLRPARSAGGFKNYDLEEAKKLIEKRIKRFRNPLRCEASKFGMTNEVVYQKLGSYLARRGFDWETIKKSIDEVLEKRV